MKQQQISKAAAHEEVDPTDLLHDVIYMDQNGIERCLTSDHSMPWWNTGVPGSIMRLICSLHVVIDYTKKQLCLYLLCNMEHYTLVIFRCIFVSNHILTLLADKDQ
jgi:hypothetical protein